MPLDDELLEELRSVVQHVPGLKLVYLFGSHARGAARADSDLDVAVLYDDAISPAQREATRRGLIGGLADALGALGERADVVDLAQVGSALGYRVIGEGRCLLATDEATRVRFEARTARRFDDDAPVRRLFRRAAKRVGKAMEQAEHGRR